MNWLLRFFGYYDKEQKQKTQDVSDYVGFKQGQFHKEMSKMHKQVLILHENTRQTYEASIQLEKMVKDVAQRIAIATGGLK